MIRPALAAISVLALALLAACGDDGGEAEPSPYGGSFPRHLVSVTPEQDAEVTNADLHVGETDARAGICAGFEFQVGEGMGETPTDRVALFFGEEDVTDSVSWVVTDDLPTSMGTACYAPPEPVIAGTHTARVHYSDLTERQFDYRWSFEVTE